MKRRGKNFDGFGEEFVYYTALVFKFFFFFFFFF
jgi:hypothetical protein